MTLNHLDIPVDRDIFLRSLIRELSGALEDVVGLKEASGFISVVGQAIGDQVDPMYRSALQVEHLNREQVAEVCVDFKRRIQGDFYVVEQDDEKIVLGNRACPFGDKVLGRNSMCMMTSNVFGSIAAENLGYAKVVIQETIAKGDSGCRITIYLRPGHDSASTDSREYFKTAGPK